MVPVTAVPGVDLLGARVRCKFTGALGIVSAYTKLVTGEEFFRFRPDGFDRNGEKHEVEHRRSSLEAVDGL